MSSRAAGPSMRTPTRTSRAESGAVTESKIARLSAQAIRAAKDTRNTPGTRRTEDAPHGAAAGGFENRSADDCSLKKFPVSEDCGREHAENARNSLLSGRGRQTRY